MRALALTVLALAMTAKAAAAETVLLHAAGSLRAALTDIVKAYEASSGNTVQAKYGPSGILKDEIAGGAPAMVFASANMMHPQALHDAGKSAPVTMFARNTLCALVKPGLKVRSASLLDTMLEPQMKVGTSTPKSDPSGDFAFEVFAKAEAIKPGAKATLEKKALTLTGAAASIQPPAGRNAYGWHVAQGRADIFLTYCTNALLAQKENPGQEVVSLPPALSVGAAYGLTVMNDAPAAAQDFARFILSLEGQSILARHGFAPPSS